MSKLLSGQSLYISKHLRRQGRARPKDAPPFEPPLAPIDPCLMTTSLGEKLWVRTLIGLWCPSLGKYLGDREYLDEGYYAIRNLPETFPPAYPIHQYGGHIPVEDETFTSREALARHRYLKDYVGSFVRIRPIYIAQLPMEWFYFGKTNPLWSFQGDVEKCYGSHSTMGSWEATVECLSWSPNPFTFAIDHNHPYLTEYRWYPGDQQHQYGVSCWHFPEGVHNFILNPAIVISFT